MTEKEGWVKPPETSSDDFNAAPSASLEKSLLPFSKALISTYLRLMTDFPDERVTPKVAAEVRVVKGGETTSSEGAFSAFGCSPSYLNEYRSPVSSYESLP